MATLPDTPTSQLTIMFADERYGRPCHTHSNTRMLQTAGFDPKTATFIPVLTGATIQATTQHYDTIIRAQLAAHDHIIGQFGIGADGHIAGILPHSPATAAPDNQTVISYEATDFTR